MEVRSYNAELAVANLCFKRLFNNIQIERTDSQGNVKVIPIVCTFDQKSRVLKNWENAEKRAQMTLPMITINRTGYCRNGERLNSYNNEVKYEISGKNRNYNLLTPVPIDISYDVSVIASYPSDIDQIASNFMVMLNNDAFVKCLHPKFEGIRMHNQIVMQDSVSEEHPADLDSTADDLTVATFQFVFKTYLFGGTQTAKKVPTQVISSYISSFISTDIIEIPASDACQFAKDHPDAVLSALSAQEVTAEITSWVDNPDLSDTIYDGFTPIIKQIDVGFYAVPQASGFIESIEHTDSLPLSARDWYRDKLIWKIDETTFADLSA